MILFSNSKKILLTSFKTYQLVPGTKCLSGLHIFPWTPTNLVPGTKWFLDGSTPMKKAVGTWYNLQL